MAAMATIAQRSTSFLPLVKALKPKNSIFCRFLNAISKAEDDIVKKIFTRQQKNFRTYLEEISKEKFVMDPNNQNSVKAYYEMHARLRENALGKSANHYANMMLSMGSSLGIPSFTQKIANLLDGAAEEAPDVRSILVLNKSLRHEAGIEDDMGADDMMFKALAKVEKSIGKPLSREDANGISIWKKEIDQINAKLKIKDEDLEMLEEEAEFAAVQAELDEMRNTAFDKMDSIKRRDGIKVDVNLSDIDHRTYL